MQAGWLSKQGFPRPKTPRAKGLPGGLPCQGPPGSRAAKGPRRPLFGAPGFGSQTQEPPAPRPLGPRAPRTKGPPSQEQGPPTKGQEFFWQEALRDLEGSGLEEGPPRQRAPGRRGPYINEKCFFTGFYTRSARKAQEAPKRRQEPPQGFKSFKRPPKRRGTTRFVRAHNDRFDF